MKVRDYELINNIHVLFEKKVIIYGVGFFGKKIFHLLKHAGIKVDILCDENIEEDEYDGIEIISPGKLNKIKSEKYLFIIGSETYRDEIINNLSKIVEEGFVCTWYGVQTAIEINIKSSFFSESFRQEYLNKKEINNRGFKFKRWFGTLYDLSTQNYDGLIYQPGKVGSSSVYETLKLYGKKMIHFHWCMFNIADKEGFGAEIIKAYAEYSELIQTDIKKGTKKIKIITMVREPIGRAVSVFLEKFRLYGIDIKEIYSDTLINNADSFVSDVLLKKEEEEWFYNELFALTGIDVFSYPFDKKSGYTIINKDNFEVLVLKMEKLDEIASIIGDFMGVEDFVLKNTNKGLDKHYKYIYQEVKRNFRISKKIFDEVYENSRIIKHFYLDDEKKSFIEKWKEYVE